MRNGVESMGTCASVMLIFVISLKIPPRFHLGVRHEFCEQLFRIFSEVV